MLSQSTVTYVHLDKMQQVKNSPTTNKKTKKLAC